MRGACRGCGVIRRGAGGGTVGVADNSGSVSVGVGLTGSSSFGSTTGGAATGSGGAATTLGGAGGSGGGATGLAGATGAGGGVAGFAATGAGDAGFAATGGGVAGLAGTAGAVCFCRIAFSASPGLEIWEKSNFGLSSSSPAARRAGLDEELPPPWRKCALTLSASSTLMELECVFFSVTPTCGRTSRIALLLTSSSLARSLIRILSTIRPRFSSATR